MKEVVEDETHHGKDNQIIIPVQVNLGNPETPKDTDQNQENSEGAEGCWDADNGGGLIPWRYATSC